MNFREQQEFMETKLLNYRAKKSINSVRLHKEENDDFRTSYQRDVGRILYSDVFRRLRLKTQVFMARDSDQHSRTRLTHTLEVNQLAKSIAKPLELNCDLVEAISLGHDLGHVPFGHAGERALNAILKEKNKSFNHNVQSVWLVEQLLFGRKDINGKFYSGLNLTLDTLEGIWKHTKINGQINEYEESLNRLNPDTKGSLEGQIVNIADSISYCVHDLCDANKHNIVNFEEFENDVWNLYFDIKFDRNSWFYIFIYNLIENNQESSEIKFSDEYREAFGAVRDFIYERIIKSPKIEKYDEESMNIIYQIYNYYDKNIELILEKNNANQYKFKKYGKERVIVDYIQWLSDAGAMNEYENITTS